MGKFRLNIAFALLCLAFVIYYYNRTPSITPPAAGLTVEAKKVERPALPPDHPLATEIEFDPSPAGLLPPLPPTDEQYHSYLGTWKRSEAVKALVEMYRAADPGSQTEILRQFDADEIMEYVRRDPQARKLIFDAASSSDEERRERAVFSICKLNLVESYDKVFNALDDSSDKVKRMARGAIGNLFRSPYRKFSDKEIYDLVIKIKSKPGFIDHPAIKNNLYWAGRENINFLLLDPVACDLRSLGFISETSDADVLFPLPLRSPTLDSLASGRNTQEKPSPEISIEIAEEINRFTVAGDQYLIDIGGGRIVRGELAGFGSISPACGRVLVGKLAVKDPKERALIAAAKTTFYVQKAPTLRGKETAPGQVLGILADYKLSADEEKTIKSALQQHIIGTYKTILSEKQAETKSGAKVSEAGATNGYRRRKSTIFDWERALAEGKGELSYEVKAVQLDKDPEPEFIVNAGWQKDGKFIEAIIVLMDKKGGEFKLLPINTVGEWIAENQELEMYVGLSLTAPGSLANVVDYNMDGIGDIIIFQSGMESGNTYLLEYTGEELKPTGITYSVGC